MKFLDNTLRDGSHYNKHSFTPKQVSAISAALDSLNLDVIEIGHGNGLGASSLQIGLSKHSDAELIRAASDVVKNSKIGVHVIPGIATYQNDVYPAIQEGATYFRVASHCTEADITQSIIELIANQQIEVWGALMMSHMINPVELAKEALKMEKYGASGVVFYDSAGTFIPSDVKNIITEMQSVLSIEVGFHAHNNLNLASANTLAALDAGATFIDGSMAGFGAGAGNLSLPHFFAVLSKIYPDKTFAWELYLETMEKFVLSNDIVFPLSRQLNVVSGVNGVFSGFVSHIIRIADQYSVNPLELFALCGSNNLVAGQEDLIVEIAQSLKFE